jgi:hypothetical protein
MKRSNKSTIHVIVVVAIIAIGILIILINFSRDISYSNTTDQIDQYDKELLKTVYDINLDDNSQIISFSYMQFAKSKFCVLKIQTDDFASFLGNNVDLEEHYSKLKKNIIFPTRPFRPINSEIEMFTDKDYIYLSTNYYSSKILKELCLKYFFNKEKL